jgi:hypothetical protein
VKPAVSSVPCNGAGGGSGSSTNEDASSSSTDIGLARLDVTEQRRVGDARDAGLREIDGGVEGTAVEQRELPAAHESGPRESERRCEHASVVVIRELGEDVRENLTGDSTAQLAGPRSETTLSGSNEPLEDGIVECVERPAVLGVDGAEAGKIT